jgi:hypothetical protein
MASANGPMENVKWYMENGFETFSEELTPLNQS